MFKQRSFFMFNNPMILVLIAVGGFLLFTMFSNKKKTQQEAEQRNSLSVGDEITTIGGIIGKIVSMKDETIVIETSRDHTHIRLLKSAVKCVDVPANAKRVTTSAKEAQAAEKKEAAADSKVAPAAIKEDAKPAKAKKAKKDEAAEEKSEETDAKQD